MSYPVEIGDLINTVPEVEPVMCHIDPVVSSTALLSHEGCFRDCAVEFFPVKWPNTFCQRDGEA